MEWSVQLENIRQPEDDYIHVYHHQTRRQHIRERSGQRRGYRTPDNLEAALAAAEAAGPKNAEMLQHCFDQYGQKVGNGQCYDLGAAPLKAIGAAAPNGTVFGDEVAREDAQPGDIIQFTWCKFKGDNPNGSYYSMYAGDEASNGMHTGVLFSVESLDPLVWICLEQNIGGVLQVTHRTYRFNDMTEGSIAVYRPKAAA